MMVPFKKDEREGLDAVCETPLERRLKRPFIWR